MKIKNEKNRNKTANREAVITGINNSFNSILQKAVCCMAALILAMMISPLNLSAEEKEISGADFSQDDWRLILVNKQHPIPWDYEIKLGTIHNGQRVDERIVTDLEHMLEAAKEDGIRLLVISPYRSSEKQQELFLQKVNRAMRKGESFLSAYRDTAQAVTVPGSSEHEIGLAVDITTKEHITLDEEYADSEGGRWLYENCSDYGFILRYPEGSEEITGIEFEPWHFRYVGKEAAKYLMENKLTLEQLWDEMRQANE